MRVLTVIASSSSSTFTKPTLASSSRTWRSTTPTFERRSMLSKWDAS
jgi:hypothetical protein